MCESSCLQESGRAHCGEFAPNVSVWQPPRLQDRRPEHKSVAKYRGGPITGNKTAHEGMEQPRYYWDAVIGPSGMIFYTGDFFPAWKDGLFTGGHATNDLVRLTLDGEPIVGEERLPKLVPQRA